MSCCYRWYLWWLSIVGGIIRGNVGCYIVSTSLTYLLITKLIIKIWKAFSRCHLFFPGLCCRATHEHNLMSESAYTTHFNNSITLSMPRFVLSLEFTRDTETFLEFHSRKRRENVMQPLSSARHWEQACDTEGVTAGGWGRIGRLCSDTQPSTRS